MSVAEKISSKILFSLVCAISSIAFSGYVKDIATKDSETFSEMYSELDTFSSNKYKKYSAITKNFDLGKKSFENSIDIDMKGLVSYPKEKNNAPILIVLSGNENLAKDANVSNKRLYKGYDYLAKSLAESGFLTLIIDTQFKDGNSDGEEIVEDKILEQLFDYHIESLKLSIEGKSNVYGLNLKDKGDLSNIGLIGQSSTARNIFNIANRKYDNQDYSIKGLLSITPGESMSISSAYPDIPTSILVAEHSLNTRIGFDMYNEIERSVGRESFATLTYLIGGNSKKFNQEIEEEKILEAKVDEMSKLTELKVEGELSEGNEDTLSINSMAKSVRAVQDVQSIIEEENLLISENTDLVNDTGLHENFLSSYCASFFKSIFDEDDEFEKIFSGVSPSPTNMYGMKVLNKYYSTDKTVIYSPDVNSKVKSKRFSIEDAVESDMAEIDTAINFNEPTNTIELKLKKLEWEKENPVLKIANKGIDYSKYNSLSIRWAINSSSSLNIASQKIAVITLEDKSGKISSVVLNSENALRKIEGREKVAEDGTYNWSRYTPLSDTRVPLSSFKNIDLNNIKKVSLSFNSSDSGSVYIDEISLVN